MLTYFVISASLLLSVSALNERPIIGVLAQSPSNAMVAGETEEYVSYVAASYVKFMESAGARVVPIKTYQSEDYYQDIVDSVNAIVFPGGANSIRNDSGYGMAGQILYHKIVEKNMDGVYLPLWATCLGFEMFFYLASGMTEFLVDCDTINIALNVHLIRGYDDSRLFTEMTDELYDIMTSENVASHFHKFCYTPEDFISLGLDEDYKILATNKDRQGLKFVDITEHKTLPFYGTQWHPEKNAYEWKNDSGRISIPHSPNSMLSSQYFANFFVNEARKNNQTFPSEEVEEASLIYNYSPKYVGNTSSSFVQVYLFE